MILSPRKAKTMDDVFKLNSDNKSTENYWIMSNSNSVTLTEQKNGESAKSQITINKAEFNRLIDWYNREQKIK